MKYYNFLKDCIKMVQLLYKESKAQINVNRVLMETFQINRGVKQGCPLSAALYILTIRIPYLILYYPLLKKIKQDKRIQGTLNSTNKTVKVIAYADDVMIIVKNQEQLGIVCDYFKMYEEVAGARLNQNKMEGVWIGENEPTHKIR